MNNVCMSMSSPYVTCIAGLSEWVAWETGLGMQQACPQWTNVFDVFAWCGVSLDSGSVSDLALAPGRTFTLCLPTGHGRVHGAWPRPAGVPVSTCCCRIHWLLPYPLDASMSIGCKRCSFQGAPERPRPTMPRCGWSQGFGHGHAPPHWEGRFDVRRAMPFLSSVPL